jgi:hypothetical protein
MKKNSKRERLATYITGVLATTIVVYTMHFMFMFPKTMIITYIVLSAVHMSGLGTAILDKLSGYTRI